MIMNVIGFVDWPDFLNELRTNPPRDRVVRVQNYTRNEPHPDIGQNWMSFHIIVAAVTENDELLTAHFLLGGAWEFALKNDEKLGRDLESRAQAALEILTDILRNEGFTVRPGIIAGSEDAKVVTTPTGLWHFQDGNLISETGGNLEAA